MGQIAGEGEERITGPDHVKGGVDKDLSSECPKSAGVSDVDSEDSTVARLQGVLRAGGQAS